MLRAGKKQESGNGAVGIELIGGEVGWFRVELVKDLWNFDESLWNLDGSLERLKRVSKRI
jgi:hypothetical protein